jgi:hypothetical protein
VLYLTALGHNVARANLMKQHFIPRDATVADLERKAGECEQQPANEQEPRATELREEEKLYRDWATTLRWDNGRREWRSPLDKQIMG